MIEEPSYQAAPRHTELGEAFYHPVAAARFKEHRLIYRNNRVAQMVGLAGLEDTAWCAHFGQFVPLPDNLAAPLALKYHGHQFRHYNPDLGDGRGFLFAQLKDGEGRLLDLGTKGSGRTPFSRNGDGRLTLKGGVREILATEMLEALGVYSSKSFSLIETGEALDRADEPSPTRSAVLVRLSHSHIRFGSFQYQAFHAHIDNIEKLIDYALKMYFPHLSGSDGPSRALVFFEEVISRTADLVASWMAAGFVHGVLNTDNMNITGESFDYGPFRFLPAVDPSFTAAYFDHHGLYAYARQPEAVAWNLAQLGATLKPLAGEAALNQALSGFGSAYETALQQHIARRFGVDRLDISFVAAFMRFMQKSAAPFEQVFFDWFCGSASQDRAARSPVSEIYAGNDWYVLQKQLIAANPVGVDRLAHPYFGRARPVSLLIEEVEAIWAPIATEDDWEPFHTKLEDIAQMRAAYGIGCLIDVLPNGCRL